MDIFITKWHYFDKSPSYQPKHTHSLFPFFFYFDTAPFFSGAAPVFQRTFPSSSINCELDSEYDHFKAESPEENIFPKVFCLFFIFLISFIDWIELNMVTKDIKIDKLVLKQRIQMWVDIYKDKRRERECNK